MAVPVVTFIGTKAVDGENVTSYVGGSVALNADQFLEGSNSVSDKVSAATVTTYALGASVAGDPYDFHVGGANELDHIFAIIQAQGSVDTLANGGVGIVVADDAATDAFGTWYVGPKTGYVGGWVYYVIDPALDFNVLGAAGTAGWTAAGNPDQLTSVDGLGARWKILNTIMGASDNCFLDVISVGQGYRVTNGDAGSAKAEFANFITFEDTSSNRYGALQNASGVLFPLGKLRIGFGSGAGNTIFDDNGFTVVWQDAQVAATFYALHVEKGSGTTDVTLKNGLLAAAGATEVYLDFVGSTTCALTSVNVDRARLIDLDGAVTWAGGTISNSGKMDLGGQPTLSSLAITTPTDGFAMEINATNELANVSKIAFDGAGVGGAGNGAVYVNISGAGPFTLNFNGFTYANRVSGSHDIVIAAGSNANYTLNITGGGSTPTVNNLGSGTVTIVVNPVTTAIHVQDVNTGSPISGARVWLPVTSSAGGKPYLASVTITSAGTTATVTHTAHGLETGDKVDINGANENDYNGTFSITKTGANSYTYTMLGDPASPATGTITATFVVLSGTTDGSGNISSSYSFTADQPVSGRVRTASGAGPYYKTAPVTATISSTAGLSVTVQLIPDS